MGPTACPISKRVPNVPIAVPKCFSLQISATRAAEDDVTNASKAPTVIFCSPSILDVITTRLSLITSFIPDKNLWKDSLNPFPGSIGERKDGKYEKAYHHRLFPSNDI